MNSQQKTINVLTMCRRAGKVVMGFDAVKEAFIDESLSGVLVTTDISPKTLKEVKFMVSNSRIPLYQICLDSKEVDYAIRKQAVVLGICDHGFTMRFKTLCDDISQKEISENGDNSK